MAYKFNPFTGQLDDAITLTGSGSVAAAQDGTAALPGISFANDLNTGIYRPGADQVAISTNGTGRLFVDANGRVGVGTAAQQYLIHAESANPRIVAVSTSTTSYGSNEARNDTGSVVTSIVRGSAAAGTTFGQSNANGAQIYSISANYLAVGTYQSNPLIFGTNNTERLRITSDGKVGLGTSSVVGSVDIAGDNPIVYIRDTKNTTYAGGEEFGRLAWYTDDGSGIGAHETAYIKNVSTGSVTTPTPNLHFGLGANNATPTDRMVLTQTGLGVGTTSPSTLLHVSQSSAGSTVIGRIENTNTGVDSDAALDLKTPNALYSLKAKRSGARFDFEVDGSPKLSIDANGRLLVGTSSARANFYNSTLTSLFQVESATGTRLTSFTYGDTGNSGPIHVLAKHRSASVGGTTVVAAGDQLGTLSFQGSDGTEFVAGAEVTAFVDGTPGANDMPGRLVFSTTADGASSPTERMRIGNDGFVNAYVDGNDGLQVRNSASAGTSTACFAARHSATSVADGTLSFIVWSNGNVVNTNNSYGAISDIKLKENIVDANSQWNDLKALQVRNYNFKTETGYSNHTQLGLIAQEVELVSPGLVTESPDRDADGNDLGTVTKSVNYSVLYMKAVKALQEAMERIEVLEQRLTDAGIA